MEEPSPAERAPRSVGAGRLLWAAVFSFATLFRLVAVLSFPVNPLDPDYREYWVLGRAIAERGSFDFGTDWRSDPVLSQSPWSYLYEERASLLRPPGYPAVVAALQLTVGDDLRRHQVVLALVDGLTALALLAIGQLLAGTAAGLAAVALFLLSPGMTYQVTRMGREPFLTLFVALGLLATLRALRRRSPADGVTAGLAFGIGGYFKETLFGAGGGVGLFLLALAVRRRRADLVRPAAALLVVLLACPLPWIARNWAAHGRFVGFTNVSGLATWIGVVPPRWIGAQPEPVQAALDHGRATDAVDADRRLRGQVRAFVLAEPGAAARTIARNGALFWSPFPRGVWERALPFGAREALSLGFYLGFFGLTCAGLWMHRSDPASALVLWLLVCLTGAHSLTVSWPRYRLPFDVLLLPFAGAALVSALEYARSFRVARSP